MMRRRERKRERKGKEEGEGAVRGGGESIRDPMKIRESILKGPRDRPRVEL